MHGFPAIATGVFLAAVALWYAFVAGTDRARIQGADSPLLVGATTLVIVALLLEYHA